MPSSARVPIQARPISNTEATVRCQLVE